MNNYKVIITVDAYFSTMYKIIIINKIYKSKKRVKIL